MSIPDASQTLLTTLKQPKPRLETILTEITALEKLRQFADPNTLTGSWQLLWTSGTRTFQKLDPNAAGQLSPGNVIQKIDVAVGWIQNIVTSPLGTLTVAGSFEYTPQKRIQFTFTQMEAKVGSLPSLKVPMGSWAKGWLQTTYLDKRIHIERGDRGGVSVYAQLPRAFNLTALAEQGKPCPHPQSLD